MGLEPNVEFISQVINTFINNLGGFIMVDGMRYLIGAGGTFLIVWVLLGGLLASRRIRKPLPAKLRNKQILRELRNSGLSILVFAIAFSITNSALEAMFGGPVFKIYSDIAEYGWPYLIFSVVLWTIGLDTYFYWSHRFMHLRKTYKFFHLEHHKSHNPTPFTAYSFAPPEAILVYLFVPAFFFFIPMHELAFTAAMLTQIIRNGIGHCGYEIFPRGWVDNRFLDLFTTVTHHDLHHEKGNGNFGFYFTFWDRAMGTEHAEYKDRFRKATNSTPLLKGSLLNKIGVPE